MRRKIELQRKQIGLVLPPPIPNGNENNSLDTSNTTNDRSTASANRSRASEDSAHQRTMEVAVTTQTDTVIDQKHVDEVVTRNNKMLNDTLHENSPSTGIEGIVSRLQKKHGMGGCKSKLASAKRKRLKRESPTLKSSPSHAYDNHDHNDTNLVSTTSMNVSNHDIITRFDQQPSSPEQGDSIDSVTSRQRPDLFFLNTVVLINGFTDPPNDSLMRMLQRYGGDVEKYETDRVTHIIAEQLSTAKSKIYKKQRKPIPVVHPRWIVESVKVEKKLPYNNYLLEQVRFHESTIKNFLSSPIKKQCIVDSFPTHDTEKESNQDLGRVSTKRPQSPPIGVIRTVGNDPTFLESYFASSRLSFIGSFKQRLKAHGHVPSHDDSVQPISATDSRRFVLHIDMDYFFAAVAIRNFPQYKDSPVAIGHRQKGDDTASTSELSTCNYIARQFGVQKGMFLKRARELCPNLVVLPYDYEGYEEVSNQLGDILQQYADNYHGSMEQVSCDEAYLEIFISELEDIVKIGEDLRQKISEDTQCTASIGISHNKLMAKLATNKIKPNGLLLVKDSPSFLQSVSLSDLPGIGYQLGQKLMMSKLKTVQNVLDLGDDDSERERILQEIVGPARATKLVFYCKGEDDRTIKAVPRKSIGAECNYGVRFDNGPYGVDHMIAGLAKEVERRMLALNIRGRLCTLKLKERKPNAPPPGKYNGCGSCIDHSKCAPLPALTNDSLKIAQVCMKLVHQIGVVKEEIRGMGIIISKLDNVEEDKVGTVSSWLKQGHLGVGESDVLKSLIKKSYDDESGARMDSHNFIGSLPSVDKFCDSTDNSWQSNSDALSLKRFSAPSTDKKDLIYSNSTIPESVISVIPQTKNIVVQPKKNVVIKSTKPKHGQSRIKDDGIHGMQTSMESIMKLASIKSRREEILFNGEKISLTQLDCLPLELQLEVTNSKSDTSTQFQHCSRREQNQSSSGSIEPEKNNHRLYKHSIPILVEPVQAYKQSRFLYSNSIAPFCAFLDGNSSPGAQEVQKIQDFLSLCITERRLDEAVQYLRILKRNQSSWGLMHYAKILEATNAHLLQKEGRVFDNEWLGL